MKKKINHYFYDQRLGYKWDDELEIDKEVPERWSSTFILYTKL